MSKRPDKERQTLDHRSPECVWKGTKQYEAIDMWSVAVVASYMCGHPFCQVGDGEIKQLIRQWTMQLGAPRADGCTGYPAWETDQRLLSNSPTATCPWPPGMAMVLGRSGQELVSSLFSYTPHERPSSSQVLEHPFLAVDCFPLMGVRPADTDHHQGFRPSIVFDNSEGLGRVDDPREAALLDWGQLYAAPGLSVKPGGLGEVPWQPSKYAFLEEQPGYNPKGYKPTLRKNIEVQRERYTLCTPIDATSIDGPLATDTGPTLSVISKADPKIRLANIADVSVSGPLSQALPREGFMASGSQEDEQMILAVRAYQDELYARQHRKWAQFLLQRWWSWVYRTSEWWRRCNEREVQRDWIYD